MRGVVKFLFSLSIGIAIIWIGFWWYAEHRLQSGFQAWAEKQAALGWKISFDSIQRGASPMNAVATVDHLTLTLPPGPNGETVTIALPAVALRIAALDPLVFHTDLPNQITVTVENNVDLVINTARIALTENLDPNTVFNRTAYPFRGGDFAASNVQILASSLLVLHIDSVTSHADLNPSAGANAAAFSTTTVLQGLALSPLLTRIASVPFDGKLAQLSFSATFSGPVPAGLSGLADQLNAVHDRIAQQKILVPIIHQWASQGGNGKLALQLIVGDSTIKSGVNLGFDADLQPKGTADLGADRLGRLTTAVTNAYPALQDELAQAEARLSPYITNTNQGGQTFAMHVTYGAGAVVVNGQILGAMPKLDWTALENPTPAPAAGSAPGVQNLPAPSP
jgi:hypothetical protein